MNFFQANGRTVAIRPERPRLSREQPSSGFARQGTVRNVLYLGATLEYHLDLKASARSSKRRTTEPGRVQVGDPVWFTATRESALEM